MSKREEIEALKAEIAYLRGRVTLLESQILNAQPLIYYVPMPVPTIAPRPWDPVWGQSYTAGAPSALSKYNG